MLTATFVLRLLLALTCVVGLIWYIGRRFGNGGPQQRTSREPGVKVVGRQSMGKHTGVAVVAVGQRRLLIGYGEQQVSMLTELGPVFDELPTPKAAASTDDAENTPTPWASVARATKHAAASLLPTQRSRRSATPKSITPESLAAAGVRTAPVVSAPRPLAAPVAPKALDASPIDRLDQAAWPTFEHVTPAAPAPAAPVAAPVGVPAVEAPIAPADTKQAALAGSILAPETWRQAVKSLQDRTVRR